MRRLRPGHHAPKTKRGDGARHRLFSELVTTLLPEAVLERAVGLLRGRFGALRRGLDPAGSRLGATRGVLGARGSLLGPRRRRVLVLRAAGAERRYQHQACYTDTNRP